jgi:hypothetical protein
MNRDYLTGSWVERNKTVSVLTPVTDWN